MKKRQIYWRRKKNKIICEGFIGNKTKYFFALPEPDEFLRRIGVLTNPPLDAQEKKSFFSPEKTEKIRQLYIRLNIIDKKQRKLA